MCRLLGISSNRPNNILLSSKVFTELSKYHSDGHGFVYEKNGKLIATKSTVPLNKNAAREEIFRTESNLFIGHLRLASHGSVSTVNTHPFVREQNGIEFAFAHNGTVSGVKNWEIGKPCFGQTDSEHAFQWILDQIRDVEPSRFARLIQKAGHKIRQLGNFNFLMTDGQKIWAYADDSLAILERIGSHAGKVIQLKRTGDTVSLQEYKAAGERAVLVASEALTDEAWRILPPGTLVVLRNGQIVDELPPVMHESSSAESTRSYRSLQELERLEDAESWAKISRQQTSDWVIAAIHGGRIEQFTDHIADAIAANEHSFYSFLGLRDRSSELHVPSHVFKCPVLSSLQNNARWTVSIHGQKDEISQYIYVGGGNKQLVAAFKEMLSSSGFETRMPPAHLAGVDPSNIVNATSEQGVQLEISLGLRRAFFDAGAKPTKLFERFIKTIRLVMDSLSEAA